MGSLTEVLDMVLFYAPVLAKAHFKTTGKSQKIFLVSHGVAEGIIAPQVSRRAILCGKQSILSTGLPLSESLSLDIYVVVTVKGVSCQRQNYSWDR